MQISFRTDQTDFEKLNTTWNQLLAKSIIDVPFLRHEYLSLWWKTLGGGEWNSGELFLGVAKDEMDEVVGIAPFFRPDDGEGRPPELSG